MGKSTVKIRREGGYMKSSKCFSTRKFHQERAHREKNRTFLPYEKKNMQQITRPGMYWFTDLSGKEWFAQIMKDGTAEKLEVGTLYPFKVDSLGVGEFIGPLPI